MNHPRPTLSWLVAALVLASTAHADPYEAAIHYTVKVRTATPVPMIHDAGQGGTGAGFLVDRARGWILTNAHVAGYGPSTVEVSFHGGEFHEARVRYIDPQLDLAVLAVPTEAIPGGARVAPCACERTVRTGEDVIAFGHPWNLDYTATRGIVSGISTRWDKQWIQTDAPLNGGNSGGPLISLDHGDVVGINTASLGGDQVQNLNFAVPMRQVCPVLALLRNGRDPTPARLPFAVAVREHGDGGLVVARVPARVNADVHPGDRILGIGGSRHAPNNLTELYRQLRGAGDRVPMTLERDGKRLQRKVRLIPGTPVLRRQALLVAGVLFGPASSDLVRAEHGPRLMVHWVRGGTPGSIAGFQAYDLVEAANGRPVHTLDDLRTVLARAGDDGRLRIVVRRLASDSSWWQYIEYVLPASPVQRIARGG